MKYTDGYMSILFPDFMSKNTSNLSIGVGRENLEYILIIAHFAKKVKNNRENPPQKQGTVGFRL